MWSPSPHNGPSRVMPGLGLDPASHLKCDEFSILGRFPWLFVFSPLVFHLGKQFLTFSKRSLIKSLTPGEPLGSLQPGAPGRPSQDAFPGRLCPGHQR